MLWMEETPIAQDLIIRDSQALIHHDAPFSWVSRSMRYRDRCDTKDWATKPKVEVEIISKAKIESKTKVKVELPKAEHLKTKLPKAKIQKAKLQKAKLLETKLEANPRKPKSKDQGKDWPKLNTDQIETNHL